MRGRQYVCVLAGWTGQAMMLGSLSAQHGWVGREHPRRLLIFALDGKARLPPAAPPARPTPLTEPELTLDPIRVERGKALFRHCASCHGLGAVAGGYAPDLRASPILTSPTALDTIVRQGALESSGMPKFAELTTDDLEDLRHFVRSRARAALAATQTSPQK